MCISTLWGQVGIELWGADLWNIWLVGTWKTVNNAEWWTYPFHHLSAPSAKVNHHCGYYNSWIYRITVWMAIYSHPYAVKYQPIAPIHRYTVSPHHDTDSTVTVTVLHTHTILSYSRWWPALGLTCLWHGNRCKKKSACSQTYPNGHSICWICFHILHILTVTKSNH